MITATTVSSPQQKNRFEAHHQGHVFDYWNELAGAEKLALEQQLGQVPVERLEKLFQDSVQAHKALKSGTSTDRITPLKASRIFTLKNSSDVDFWNEKGLSMIAAGQVAVLVLAGGQGTRLGTSLPKGMYDIGLPSHKSLFQLFSQRILRLQELATSSSSSSGSKCVIPFFVMTSDATHEITVEYFRSNAFFHLSPDQVHFFQQGFLPAMSPEGKIILTTKGKLSLSPDGNGGVFRALAEQGMLALLDAKYVAVKYIQMFSVDNVLVKVGDPVFFGFCEAKGAECAAKSVVKVNAKEKVGVFGSRNGRVSVVEYSEISEAQANEVADPSTGTLAFGDANIAVHVFSVDFLKKLTTADFVYHVAEKMIPTQVSGKPESVKAIKLETFIFDSFQYSDHFYLLQVPREAEFAPVKNASGPGIPDSPETAKALVFQLHHSWITAAGGVVQAASAGSALEVEISPILSYAGEGLQSRCHGQTFLSPVHLEK